MKSIDKLREAATYNPAFSDNATRIVCNYLSEIEAEIADNYMRLPCDANGVPIHVGDTIEGELFCGNATVRGTVCAYHIHDDDELGTVCIRVKSTKDTWIIKELRFKRCRHVKPRTLEDVIEGAINAAFGNEAPFSAIAKKAADEIRELLGGERR